MEHLHAGGSFGFGLLLVLAGCNENGGSGASGALAVPVGKVETLSVAAGDDHVLYVDFTVAQLSEQIARDIEEARRIIESRGKG